MKIERLEITIRIAVSELTDGSTPHRRYGPGKPGLAA